MKYDHLFIFISTVESILPNLRNYVSTTHKILMHKLITFLSPKFANLDTFFIVKIL